VVTETWPVPLIDFAAPSELLMPEMVGPKKTSTGVVLVMSVPSPSCPFLFRPQHFAPPAVVRAHVSSNPAEIAETPLVSPVTSTGVVLARWRGPQARCSQGSR
jgi:hypothetical protein